ncbi:MAG: hypothetical protein K9K88_01505 [Desulfobacterales bacterium]|nr:hypothetical protein [Desulfobacterales bacterium]
MKDKDSARLHRAIRVIRAKFFSEAPQNFTESLPNLSTTFTFLSYLFFNGQAQVEKAAANKAGLFAATLKGR